MRVARCVARKKSECKTVLNAKIYEKLVDARENDCERNVVRTSETRLGSMQPRYCRPIQRERAPPVPFVPGSYRLGKRFSSASKYWVNLTRACRTCECGRSSLQSRFNMERIEDDRKELRKALMRITEGPTGAEALEKMRFCLLTAITTGAFAITSS